MKKKHEPIAKIGATLVVLAVFVATKHVMKKYGQAKF